MVLYKLLESGYLPQELPPLFSSRAFALFVKNKKDVLASEFTKVKPIWTQPVHHNIARVGGLRRRLSTPNPVNFFRLANAFRLHATIVKQQWAKSAFSHTKPAIQLLGKRAIAPMNPDRASPRALARIGARYLLHADISQFYPSIYTHTVPWALHTKKIAKSSINDMTLAGNLLDQELRGCQQGQTKGVPIGPDTSLGIAELLLAIVDTKIEKSAKPIGGVRFIDDMEFGFAKLAEAEAALVTLEASLHEFELQLNQTKTRIVELPDVFDSRYVTDLRSSIPQAGSTARSPWIDYFNRAFSLAREFPADGVLRYAVASLQYTPIPKKHWELVQSLLWQSVTGDAGCLRFVIDVLLVNTLAHKGMELDKKMAEDSINALILRNAVIEHGSEVVWSIWAALLFKLKLSGTSLALSSRMDDSFVATIVQLAIKHGVFAEDYPSEKWLGWICEDCFGESNWLWVYEAYQRGWAKAEVKKAKVGSNAVCKAMKESGVTFIDESQILKYAAVGKKALLPLGTSGY